MPTDPRFFLTCGSKHTYIYFFGLKNDKRATYFLSYSLASSFLMNNQNGEINEPKVYIAAVGYK